MNKKFAKDVYRVYGRKETLKERILRPPEMKYLRLFRICQTVKFPPLLLYYRLRLRSYSYKTKIQIPHNYNIGEGLFIGHLGRILIHERAHIGSNCNIATGLLIGQQNRGSRRGVPYIGNNVWIGANTAIVGKVTIGDDVMIAPLSYINFDVPSHSIVLGNPGRIIPKENATEGYINNVIIPSPEQHEHPCNQDLD